jgi:hypothetical protein
MRDQETEQEVMMLSQNQSKTKDRGKTSKAAHEQLAAAEPAYIREVYRTFLTAPEWRNVDMAVEMAEFLGQNKPLYRFPYLSQILTLWWVFFSSINAARANNYTVRLVFTEYTLMNLFISITATIEYLWKGIVSLPFWLLLRSENNTTLQKHVARIHKDYSEFIHHTPFYHYGFLSKIGPMWGTFLRNPESIADLITVLVTTVELLIRSFPTLPIKLYYTQPSIQEPEIIHVLLKRDDSDQAQTLLEAVELRANNVKLNEKILVTKINQGKINKVYSHVEFKRYMPFKDIVEAMAEMTPACDEVRPLVIKRVAGQNELQLDFETSPDGKEALKAILGPGILYSYSNSIDDNKIFTAKIKAEELIDTVRAAKVPGVTLKLIHDF